MHLPPGVCLLHPVPHSLRSTPQGKRNPRGEWDRTQQGRKMTEGVPTTHAADPMAFVSFSNDAHFSMPLEEEEKAVDGGVVPEVLEEMQQVVVMAHYTVLSPAVPMNLSTRGDCMGFPSKGRQRSGTPGGAGPNRMPSLTTPPVDGDAYEDDAWRLALNAEEEEKWRSRLEDPFFSLNDAYQTKDGDSSLDSPHRRRHRRSLASSKSRQMHYYKEEFSAMLREQHEEQRNMRVRVRDTLLYTARHIGGVEAELAKTLPLLLSTVRTSSSPSSSFVSHST